METSSCVFSLQFKSNIDRKYILIEFKMYHLKSSRCILEINLIHLLTHIMKTVQSPQSLQQANTLFIYIDTVFI